MKVNIRALAIAASLTWGGALFFVYIGQLIWPPYGNAFLELVESVYPGIPTGSRFGRLLLGTIYGLVDGAMGGLVIGWIYNKMID